MILGKSFNLSEPRLSGKLSDMNDNIIYFTEVFHGINEIIYKNTTVRIITDKYS